MSIFAALLLSLSCHYAFAISSTGTSTYTSMSFPGDTPSGVLAIRGESAEGLFYQMSNVETKPEVTNLKELNPNQVSLQMLKRKHGDQVSCFNRPETDGEQWKLDGAGDLIYVMTCIVNFNNATTGTINSKIFADGPRTRSFVRF